MTHAWTVCQCWLGPRSDDPLRCGLNSCHYHIYAMRNLPKFARIPQGEARYCLFTAFFGFLTFYLGLKDWHRMAGTQPRAGWCMVLMLLVQT